MKKREKTAKKKRKNGVTDRVGDESSVTKWVAV